MFFVCSFVCLGFFFLGGGGLFNSTLLATHHSVGEVPFNANREAMGSKCSRSLNMAGQVFLSALVKTLPQKGKNKNS